MAEQNESAEYWMGLSDKEKVDEWQWYMHDSNKLLEKGNFTNWKSRSTIKSMTRNCALINE